MKRSTLNVFVILVAILPLAYLAITWSSVPEQVPVHFDAHMKPDRMGTKGELVALSAFMAAISVISYFFLHNIRKIDPKRRNAAPSTTFNKLGAGLAVFLAALNLLIILAATKNAFVLNHLLLPLLGLLFAFIGNYMHNIKPNYFAGLRLPWTLSDDENWRKTHLLAGKLWFWCGLAFSLISLFLPPALSMGVFFSMIVVIVLIPVLYSYQLFKSKA